MKRAAHALLLAAVPACALPPLALEPRYGPVDVGGDIGVSAGVASADNSVDEAGLEDDDGALSVRADLDWGDPHLTVQLRRSQHDGSGTLGADMSQGATTIPAGTDVVTDSAFGLYTAYLTWDLAPGEDEFGLGFGLAAVDTDFHTTDGTSTIAVHQTLPVPFLAGRGRMRVGPLELEALAGFVAVAALEDEYHFLDLDLAGRLPIFRGERATGVLTLGLRHTLLDFVYDDGSDEIAEDLRLTGPYLGLRVEL